MPEVDFVALCEHVRVDNGLLHMISAGVDHAQIPAVPAGFNFGIGLRLAFTRLECEQEHAVVLVFQDEDGQSIARIDGRVRPEFPANTPPGWPTHATLAFNLGVPVPKYGIYSFELAVDGQSKKSISVIVEPPARPSLPGA